MLPDGQRSVPLMNGLWRLINAFWCCCSMGLPTKPPLKAQLYWETASYFASDRSSAVFPVSQSPFDPASSRDCQQPLEQVKYFEVILLLHRPWCGWNYGRVVSRRGCRAPHQAEMQTIILSTGFAAFTVTHFLWWRQSAVLSGLLSCLVGWCV